MKFQNTFKELNERVADLKDMLKYEVEWGYLGSNERSAIEDMMGLCEDYVSMAHDVLGKYSKGYAELHGDK